MNNSALVTFTKKSPNHSGKRTHAVDRITPHCMAGHMSLQGLGAWFAKSSTQASSNYGIDDYGKVGLYVDEDNRSWASSDKGNDQRAITIEIASDSVHPYKTTDAAITGLIKLCEDICRRYGKKKLLWFGDKAKSLAYQPKADEMVITVHRWFANKACPGDHIYNKLGTVAAEVTKRLGGATSTKPSTGSTSGNFKVRVDITDLNIRKGPGTDTAKTGQKTGKGTFTITEVKSGKGSTAGWGKLKSGAGWISLDYATRI